MQQALEEPGLELQMAAVSLSNEVRGLAPKQAHGTRGKPIQLTTNLTEIGLDESKVFFKYDVRIWAIIARGGENDAPAMKELTKQMRDDFPELERKERAKDIFGHFVAAHRDLFKVGLFVIYDRAAMLFTTEQLTLEGDEQAFELPPDFTRPFHANCIGFRLTIKKAGTEESNEVAATRECLEKAADIHSSDKSLLEVLNLATSQSAFFDESIVSYGNGIHYMYQPPRLFGDLPDLPDATYVGVGASSAVKVLEGGKPYLVTELKKTSFHAESGPHGAVTLLDKIASMEILAGPRYDLNRLTAVQMEAIGRHLRGLFVQTKYEVRGRKLTFKIKCLAPSAATQITLDDGRTTTIENYYLEKYDIRLKHRSLFTVENHRGARYPVELLVVAPSQRVKTEQMSPSSNSALIKASATAPSIRLRQTEAMKEVLGLTAENQNLENFGIRLNDQFKNIEARHLPDPLIVNGNGKVRIDRGCEWKYGRFVQGATVSKWGVVVLYNNRPREPFNVKNYFDRLVDRSRELGLVFDECNFVQTYHRACEDNIEEVYAEAKQRGVTYVVFVSAFNVNLHGYIKMLEARHQVVSQEIHMNNAMRAQRQTLDNVIAKANSKNGGLNHAVRFASSAESDWLSKRGRLIVGLQISHPKSSEAATGRNVQNQMPSILGWSANCADHPQKYVGDYVFAEPGEMDIALCEAMSTILTRFGSSNGFLATEILIYFNGVTEGQWNLVAETFMKCIRKAISRAKLEYNPHLCAIVYSKCHNERFFKKNIPRGKPSEQNIQPGTICDRTVCSNSVNEFYLNAHEAFQGTSKTPKYSVLVNTNALSMDEIEGITHGLCFLHEITSKTVSMPAPLMIADRCSKRGHDNYLTARKYDNSPITAERANRELTNGDALRNLRYNA